MIYYIPISRIYIEKHRNIMEDTSHVSLGTCEQVLKTALQRSAGIMSRHEPCSLHHLLTGCSVRIRMMYSSFISFGNQSLVLETS